MSRSTITDISLLPLTEPAESSGPVLSGASEPTLVGELIGPYRVTGTIGSGAMGNVLSAVDEQLGRSVALKLIRSELSHPSFRMRFRQEAQAMALVNDPNVVTIYSFGEHRGVPYFAMEFVEGRPLDRLIREEHGMVHLDTAVHLLDQACLGLSAIHRAGALHRDIKPGNLLVDRSSRLRIGDLGLAASYRDSHVPREVVGTPGYIAPEVLLGRSDATPKSDLYSLACVAYELLSGKQPFEGKESLDLAQQHIFLPLTPPTRWRPTLPAAFDLVLGQALAKDPELRPPSVELFRRALGQALHDALEPSRILIVEDDADLGELLELALSEEFAGAEVERVTDGAAALASFAKKPASVVVSDLQMPNMDGADLTARLRARSDAETVPVIVLTASGGSEEWRQLASIGADRFVVKPANIGDLATAIRSAVRERRAQRVR